MVTSIESLENTEVKKTIEGAITVIEDGAAREVEMTQVLKWREFVDSHIEDINLKQKNTYPANEKNKDLKVNPRAVEIIRDLLPKEFELKDVLDLRLRFNPGIYEGTGLEGYAKAFRDALVYFEEENL